MGILREIFGPSKKEIWQELCKQIGGDYEEGGFFKEDKVVVHIKQWTVTLDTYTVSTGKSSSTYTRIRAPYVNKDGIRFKIYRSGFFSNIGTALGMQDIEVGYPEFDEDFVIKGNNEQKIMDLLKNEKIRMLMQQQPQFNLQVKDDEGCFGSDFPEGVDELYFSVYGVITDIEQLKSLFDLFAEVLDQLCIIGCAYESNPGVSV